MRGKIFICNTYIYYRKSCNTRK